MVVVAHATGDEGSGNSSGGEKRESQRPRARRIWQPSARDERARQREHRREEGLRAGKKARV